MWAVGTVELVLHDVPCSEQLHGQTKPLAITMSTLKALLRCTSFPKPMEGTVPDGRKKGLDGKEQVQLANTVGHLPLTMQSETVER